MSIRILAHLLPDEPTLAQRVEALVGDRLDESLNDPRRSVPEVLFVLGVQTALTVEHLAELFVARPLCAAVCRAVAA